VDDHRQPFSPSQTSSRTSSIEPCSQMSSQASSDNSQAPSNKSSKESFKGLPLKRKRKDERVNDQDIDKLLVKNLKALDEPIQEDEEEVFGWQVAIIMRRLTPRQKAQAKLKIQRLLVDIEFPELID